MKALIIGANGLIGSHCLKELLTDDQYSGIEIWVRRSSGFSHPKLKESIINFDQISGIAPTEADHVFCCLGTTINKVKTREAFSKIDRDYVAELARLAERSGCEKFMVVSSIGADLKSKNFYLKTKGEMEEAVKNCSIPAIYVFRPSMLLGKREEFRLGEKIGKAFMVAFNFMFVGKLRKYRGIQASTVAMAMIRIARNNEKGIFVFESDEIENIMK